MIRSKMMSLETALNVATEKISTDIGQLQSKRENALSAFRSTAQKLTAINDKLSESMEKLDSIAGFAREKMESAAKMKSDNEKVRAKILEIIGED